MRLLPYSLDRGAQLGHRVPGVSLRGRHHGTSRSRRQFVFAVLITVIAIVVLYFALRAIPAAERPTIRPPGTVTTVRSLP